MAVAKKPATKKKKKRSVSKKRVVIAEEGIVLLIEKLLVKNGETVEVKKGAGKLEISEIVVEAGGTLVKPSSLDAAIGKITQQPGSNTLTKF